jgi:hypothetical protein
MVESNGDTQQALATGATIAAVGANRVLGMDGIQLSATASNVKKVLLTAGGVRVLTMARGIVACSPTQPGRLRHCRCCDDVACAHQYFSDMGV